MTEPEANKLVTVLITAFPGQFARMAPQQIADFAAVYRRMLGDLDYLAANAAVERLLASAKFLPTIAEIRETCLSITEGERRTGGDAWGEVLRMIGAYGAYRSPLTDFAIDDPVARKCVMAMGWRNLCLSENQVADRARFIEMYDQESKQERVLQLTEGLPAMRRLRAAQALEAGRALPKPSNGVGLGQLIGAVFSDLDKEGD